MTTPLQLARMIKELEGNYEHRYLNGVLITSKLAKKIIKALKELKHNEEGHMEINE